MTKYESAMIVAALLSLPACQGPQTEESEVGSSQEAKVSPEEDVNLRAVADLPPGLARIKLAENAAGEVVFIDDGQLFEEGTEAPLILYSTNSDGALLNLAVAFACPFAQLNPAILDVTELEFDRIIVGSQDLNPTTASCFVNSSRFRQFFIDADFVVYEIVESNSYYELADGGPYVSLRLFDANRSELSAKDYQVFVWVQEGTFPSSKILPDGRLLLGKVPRQKLLLDFLVERCEAKWSFELFPSFRAASEDLVEFEVFNVPSTAVLCRDLASER